MDLLQTDSHAHVIDPLRFPYVAAGGYIPKQHETGEAAAFRTVLQKHGISQGLLVQPSCYGFDNSAMLSAIANEPAKLRGIAVVEPTISERDVQDLKIRGVVGVRLNVGSFDPHFFERPEADTFLNKAASFGWFVQIYAQAAAWQTFGATLLKSDARIIIDHMGHPKVSAGTAQPGFEIVRRIGRETNAVVKLSAAFRVSQQPYPHADVDPYVALLLESFGVDRCIWGSDWPFINTPLSVRYDEQLACFERWVTSPQDRDRILSRNPARLFGFGGRA